MSEVTSVGMYVNVRTHSSPTPRRRTRKPAPVLTRLGQTRRRRPQAGICVPDAAFKQMMMADLFSGTARLRRVIRKTLPKQYG